MHFSVGLGREKSYALTTGFQETGEKIEDYNNQDCTSLLFLDAISSTFQKTPCWKINKSCFPQALKKMV